MKKLLVLTCIMMLGLSAANAENQIQPRTTANPEIQEKPIRMNRHQAFEEKLNLTDIQKQKVRKLREKSFKKIKPLMDEIKVKKEEIQAVKKSRIAVEEQEIRITKLEREIEVLDRKVKKIRKANMKDFEAILTPEQKAILQDMKKEGKKRHETRQLNAK